MAYVDNATSTEDYPSVIVDLAHLVTTMVEQQVPERHITPLRTLIIQGQIYLDSYGVTHDDWTVFLLRCVAEVQRLSHAIEAKRTVTMPLLEAPHVATA